MNLIAGDQCEITMAAIDNRYPEILGNTTSDGVAFQLVSTARHPPPADCSGEVMSWVDINWNLSPPGYFHTSSLPQAQVQPRPECVSVMPIWLGGTVKDDPGNRIAIQTSGRYLVEFWGNFDGLEGKIRDHNASVACFDSKTNETVDSLDIALSSYKTTHFQASKNMNLNTGDHCYVGMSLTLDTPLSASLQASCGIQIQFLGSK